MVMPCRCRCCVPIEGPQPRNPGASLADMIDALGVEIKPVNKGAVRAVRVGRPLSPDLAKTEGEKFVGLAHLNANGNKGDKKVRFESRARLKAYIAGFNRALELSLETHESGEKS